MNRIKQLIWILLVAGFWIDMSAQERITTMLVEDWKFAKGHQDQGASQELDDSAWETVIVPHDWAISGPFVADGDGNTGKLPWQGEGWYRRSLDIPAEYAQKRLYLLFDGVMAFPSVYLNGELAGQWDYGYNSFFLDITDFVEPGAENLLAVHADTRPHDSRWYPGAGLYRKVQLIAVSPVHAAIWGAYVTSPVVKPNYADVRVQLRVKNMGAMDTVQITHEIISPEGEVVAMKHIKRGIQAGKEGVTEGTMTLRNPRHWDINDPVLYTVRSTIMANDQAQDQIETEFGVRTFRFDPDHGFFLNGRRLQLKGVNLHHDHGPLGAAFYPRAMERQLEIMKSMGVNAIRNSHNVAAPELLTLCDRMGFLVLNEIFDKYDAKAGIHPETDFEDFAHRNVRNFVLRDRNHPSVFLWSVGNEIGDVQWNKDNGFHRLHTMLNYVNKYDPTRPTTLVNDQWLSAELRHFDYYDVHCYNYSRRYRLARQLEPNKSVIISESASTLSTRGFYEFPLPLSKTDFTQSLQVSSYDLHAPWWAEIADDDFMWQQDESYIAGEFVWTGFDYLGEPTPYTNETVIDMGMTDREAARSSYFGIVDLVGIPKDRYYLYKSYWKPEDTTIHILPHWNWPDRVGKSVPVFVYTNGDCAELFVNGKSEGMQCKEMKSDSSTRRFRLMWPDVVYQPGSLEVVAYKEGLILGRKSMRTAGEASQLRIRADRTSLDPSGLDLAYLQLEMLDEDGNVVPWADHMIELTLTGPASIVGVGNGNPQSLHPFQSKQVPLFYGKAMVIIRSNREVGTVTLTATAESIESAQVELVVE